MKLVRAAAHRVILVAPALTVLIALSGCAGTSVHESSRASSATGTTGTTAATAAPSPSIDPKAAPAVHTWGSFLAALAVAETHPYLVGEDHPAAADFARFAWDPARYQFADYISDLKRDGLAQRGAPHQSHVTVTAIDLAATVPAVTLADCLTGVSRTTYHAATGQTVPAPAVTRPPPYLATVTVILHQRRWGVQKVSFKEGATCSA